MNVPETFFTVSDELWLFFLSCAAGAVFGVYYDVFRALRLTIPHHGFFVFLEDVIFLATYAIFLSAFASAEARGELRAYYAFGGILGFTLYHFTIGRFVMRFIKKIIGSVKIIFAIIVKPAKIIAAKFVGITKNAVKSNKNAPQPLQYDAEI
ncbi:MAG: spore cortex biosynthesis protein YabQ [Ruminococcus sp.]|nr:spore cortex biosynthesis protein YabQ [Ruminococcus sp.]